MKKKASEMSVFEMVMAGLEDSIAFSNGKKLSLVTVRVPAPPPPMDAKAVTEVRKSLNMSQGVFAAALNVSPKTVQGWEQGVRTPSNASLRLLQIAREEPHAVLKVFRGKDAQSHAPEKALARRSGARAKA
ncbi:MAG: helix-turn-helix domain-containing protein [Candidatus Hydrogenedentes bacterium]|nr:helix-turn-helix domain-containing protein [Candidatus Hydrogenedentota bacterium]